MKRFFRMSPALDIASSTLLCKLRWNFISSLALLDRPKLDSRNISAGMPPPPPSTPYITLNTDGSALSNPGIAGAGGILRDHLGHWIAGFSLHLGIATNNTVELAAV